MLYFTHQSLSGSLIVFMNEPTYRQALHASWKLAWNHKDLWPFGLFAMLWGQFGLMELLTKIGSAAYLGTHTTFWELCRSLFTRETWLELGRLFSIGAENWIWVVWMALLLLGIAFGLVYVASVTQGALVYAGAKFSKLRLKYPNEAKAWHVGAEHAWKIIALNVLRKVVLWLAVGWAGFASWQLATTPTGFDHFVFWLAFIVALLVGLVTSIILMYAVGYVVVEEYRVSESIRAAWHLFLHHPIVSIEVALVTFFLNIGLLLFAMFAVLYVFFLPNILVKYLVFMFQAPLLGKIVGVASYGLFLAVMMAASAIFTVFVITVWSYLFSKMHHGNFVSRLVRTLRR